MRNGTLVKSKDVDLSRLPDAWRASRRVLRKFRENRREFVREYAGGHYAEDGAPATVYVNLIAQYVSIVVRSLTGQNLRGLVTPRDRSHKPLADAMQAWLNGQFQRMNLAGELERVVLDAAFSIGIAKVALATPSDAAQLAWGLRGGQPFVRRVDLDDFAFDPHARDFAEVGFIGHRFRVPLDAVRDSPLYDRAERGKLTASEDPRHNRDGDERVNRISTGHHPGYDAEFEEHADLWEFYFPRRRLLVTVSDDQVDGESEPRPLRVVEWVGPDAGPYHVLGLCPPPPNNAMPKSPLMDLYPLHCLLNNLYRKLAEQAERQKDVLAVRRRSADDAANVGREGDGGIIPVDNPEDMKTVSFPGANPGNNAFFEQGKGLYSWLAGNLDSLGGLQPQAKTLGQDAMLERNSSRLVADMQERVVGLTSRVMGALGWYYYHHPKLVMKSEKSVPGTGAVIPRSVYPAGSGLDPREHHVRDVSFDELAIRVDPYSMPYSTPKEREAKLDAVVTQTLMPLFPLLQQQGVQLDAAKYLEKKAEYGDVPDLPEIVSIQEPPQSEPGATPGGGAERPPMPANTTRTYQRVNRSEATGPGVQKSTVQALLGQNPGGANGAAIRGV